MHPLHPLVQCSVERIALGHKGRLFASDGVLIMPMPQWFEIMRPVLVVLEKDGGFVTSQSVYEKTARIFELTEEELEERLKSGQQRYRNRMGWAITDLGKAGLLEHGGRQGRYATYAITDEGRKFLKAHDAPFNEQTLIDECPSFRQWIDSYQNKGDSSDKDKNPSVEEESLSPQEIMAKADKEIRDALAEELLQAVAAMNAYAFEYLVGKLLKAMGYGEPQITKKSGDDGIDGIVKADQLGFDNIYFQAKKWALDKAVSKPEIQKFSGALNEQHAQKGLFITTARFTAGAEKFARTVSGQRIVLVDGDALAHHMIEYNVGVAEKESYVVKAIDTDFFEE